MEIESLDIYRKPGDEWRFAGFWGVSPFSGTYRQFTGTILWDAIPEAAPDEPRLPDGERSFFAAAKEAVRTRVEQILCQERLESQDEFEWEPDLTADGLVELIDEMPDGELRDALQVIARYVQSEGVEENRQLRTWSLHADSEKRCGIVIGIYEHLD